MHVRVAAQAAFPVTRWGLMVIHRGTVCTNGGKGVASVTKPERA